MTALARWISGHLRSVLIIAVLVAVVGGVGAASLAVKSDLSYLLPESVLSVRHLRALEKRANGAAATFMIGIESADPRALARAGRALTTRLNRLDRHDVGSITTDDGIARTFAWKNRFLFASVEDLEGARDVLRKEILKLNPLYVDLDESDEGPSPGVPPKQNILDVLEHRLEDARRHARNPDPLVSKDGTLQLVVVHTTFNGGDLDRGAPLAAKLQAILDEVQKESGTAVHLGMAGDVVSGMAEQDGLIHGMVIATVLTLGLVLFALCYYFRSAGAVAALSWSLTVGAVATFGLTRVLIGHLNIASAFLSSIVIGNGINFGIILLGRYMEERRAGAKDLAAMSSAMKATARGTLAAASTAGLAYLSLALTPFRGFRDFGVIGGMGMVLCWVCAYTVLPAGVLALERRGWMAVRPSAAVVAWLERVLPRRSRLVYFVTGPLFVLAAVGAWRYVERNPLETNLGNLSSHSPRLDAASAWTDKFDKAFGHGLSGGFAIAVPTRQAVAPLVRRLRDVDKGKSERQRIFSQVSSLDDLVPSNQTVKQSLLGEIRGLIDKLTAKSSGGDQARLLSLRPPDVVPSVGDGDVPADLAWPYIEKDGSRGRIILANAGLGINSWDTRDLRRFTKVVRAMGLDPDVLIGGAAFVFTDMLDAVERDGPRATLAAVIGAIVVVLSLLGLRRQAAITLFCGAFGTLAFLALAGAMGLKVNFLDFVALPITIGIGIDYSVNIVLSTGPRSSVPGENVIGRLASAHGTTSAVILCSYTTMVGYGSLLVSQNRGIRSFGLAAMVGEITCLMTALLVARSVAETDRSSRGPGPRAPIGELDGSPAIGV